LLPLSGRPLGIRMACTGMPTRNPESSRVRLIASPACRASHSAAYPTRTC
jgi:hypothetical protein